jgi:N-methylhydantoinase B
LHGGKAGAVNTAVIIRNDGRRQDVKKATELDLDAGDRVTFTTAGGGGYGDPGKRDRAELQHDIAAGLVSPEAAAKIYGIELKVA